jgi:hypothetical protein
MQEQKAIYYCYRKTARVGSQNGHYEKNYENRKRFLLLSTLKTLLA